jgi:hypothetical protein
MELVILALANWRISSLLTNEDEHGPYEILDKIRWLAGIAYDEKGYPYADNEFAKLFMCLWCMSIWIGIIQTILYVIIPVYTTWLFLPFALSAAAILIEEKWLERLQ